MFSDLTGETSGYLMEGSGDVLIVTFGGIMQGMGLPTFEFRQLLSTYETQRLFVRDHAQSWYHRGVLGLGEDLLSTASALSKISKDFRKKLFIGNSMGGFAALYFGAVLNADRVIAFSPQTFIDVENRSRFGDARWGEQIKRLHANHPHQVSVFDLHGLDHSRAEIFVGEKSPLDVIHAQRLAGSLLELRMLRDEDHGLVRNLRETGELDRILRSALSSFSS